MKDQILYLVVNVTNGFVLDVYNNYLDAADQRDRYVANVGGAEYKVIHIFDEDIVKVGELNVN